MSPHVTHPHATGILSSRVLVATLRSELFNVSMVPNHVNIHVKPRLKHQEYPR
jgi:hypothetical protein